jgi:hypothetical protein
MPDGPPESARDVLPRESRSVMQLGGADAPTYLRRSQLLQLALPSPLLRLSRSTGHQISCFSLPPFSYSLLSERDLLDPDGGTDYDGPAPAVEAESVEARVELVRMADGLRQERRETRRGREKQPPSSRYSPGNAIE